MENSEQLDVIMTGMALGLSVIAAHLLFIRGDHREVHLPLALFFTTQALKALPLAFSVTGLDQSGFVVHALSALSFPATMAGAPLIWFYVCALTSEGHAARPRIAVHFTPAACAAFIAALYISLPLDILNGLKTGVMPEAASGSSTLEFVTSGMLLLKFAHYILVAVYLILILGRLTIYRARLKQLFASTEKCELRWISTLAFTTMTFWCFSALNSWLDVCLVEPKNTLIIEQVLRIGVLWVFASWGLRQKPGFEHQGGAPAETAEWVKYSRSALNEDHAARIARKIEIAMERDMLYRDANLSLWDLAKHIGVSSNYVSQTLNETLGKTFYDYVNAWRIRDAVQQIRDTDETILAISYDVGFNSRSSFYTAFKREMNMTPSALKRQSMEITGKVAT